MAKSGKMTSSHIDLIRRAGWRSETCVTVTFDEPELCFEMLIEHDVSIHAAARANDLLGVGAVKAQHGWQSVQRNFSRVATDRQAGLAAIDDHRWKHAE